LNILVRKYPSYDDLIRDMSDATIVTEEEQFKQEFCKDVGDHFSLESEFLLVQNDRTGTACERAVSSDKCSAEAINKLEKKRDIIIESLKKEGLPINGNIREMTTTNLYMSNKDHRRHIDNFVDRLIELEEITSTLSYLYKKKLPYNFVLESNASEMKDGPIESAVEDEHVNIVDVGGNVSTETDAGSTGFMENSLKTNLNLSSYLERPQLVADLTISIGSNLSYNVNIWNALLNTTSMRTKLNNFGFLHADCNVRISISATPFHQGKVLVSYVPFPQQNRVAEYYDDGTGSRINLLRYLSQQEGAKVMDIRDNTPLEFCFPYVSPQPVGRLFNFTTTALADTTPLNDFKDLGTLYLRTINPVLAASTSPTNVSINIYGWLSNVKLGCPTGTLMSFTLESDERKTGPIEKMASRLALISKNLMSVPLISPYAAASKSVFKGMANMASLFGWSYPTMVTQPNRMKNEPYQNGANLIGYDMGHRLTLDPLQEVTVDPRMGGRSIDEMSLQFLTTRESYYSSFNWSPDAPQFTPYTLKGYLQIMIG
jgi:hypothetical protein